MTENFIGELRLFPYGRCPDGWVPCDGRLLAVQQNAALYSLIGAKFGGDGKTNFALPDLRGRVAVGADQGGGGQPSGGGSYIQGQAGGTETVQLTPAQLPPHTHSLGASAAQDTPMLPPAGNYMGVAMPNGATSPAFNIYAPAPAPSSPDWTALHASTFSTVGAGAGHENRQPILALNICIATKGLYPPRP